MNAAEIMAALEIEETAPAGVDPIVQTAGAEVAPLPPASETALELDKWAMRKGEELFKDNEALKTLAKAAADKVKDSTDRRASEQREREWKLATADFHGAAFEPDLRLAPRCENELRGEFVKAMVETPDLHEIRASTVLNEAAAEIATAAFASQYAKRLEEDARDRGRGKGKAAGDDGEIKSMRAAAAACAAAKKEVSDLMEAADACGIGGFGPGSNGSKLDPKRLAALHNRVKKSPNLRRIAELAGRFRRVAQSRQRMKTVHGVDEVIGVTLGDEIARLLPAELAQLACPELETDLCRRLIDKECLTRDFRANEPAGRGPIVVTVDESGSMNGNKIETAKALALALAWVARKQKRWCCLVGFSWGCTAEEVKADGALLVIPPGKADEQKLLDWLEHFYSGGTDMDVPLDVVPQMWDEFVAAGMQRGKTDIVMITDAQVHLPEDIEKRFKAFKAAERVKLTLMVVQATSGESVRAVADTIYEVPALSPDCDAVGEVLSV